MTEPTKKQLEDGVRKEKLHDKERFIQRELNSECLNCGKSLKKEIMAKEIHIHLCEECRMYYFKSLMFEPLKMVQSKFKLHKKVLETLNEKEKIK